jgi:type IV secretion system protein VirD4
MSLATEVALIGLALSLGLAELARRRRTPGLVVFWVAVAGLVGYLVGGWWLVVPLAGGLGWVAWWRGQHRSAQSMVARWHARNDKHAGMASRWELWRHHSRLAMRRKATVWRPSFAAMSRWERWSTPVTQYALPIARVGLTTTVWVPIEETICQYGRPRRGKTAQLIHWVCDSPGFTLTTSTKRDLYDITEPVRAEMGPTLLFNPTALGDLPTTLGFDPLLLCQFPQYAEERAVDLISGGVGGRSEGEGRRWDEQAQRVLAALLHAAAIGGLEALDVLRWVASPDEYKPLVVGLLRESPAAVAYLPSAEQFFATNSRTRSSVTFTIMPALAWLTNPHALAATRAATPFDVRELLRERATIYLLGRSETRIAPLLSALTGYFAREARRYAATFSFGRLDPPGRLVLDEAAAICPVPLDEWFQDFGSQGLTLIATFQSLAQVRQRWGWDGAKAIRNNTGTTILHAYGSDEQDLAAWSALSGQVMRDGRPQHVLTLPQLMTIPRGSMAVWPGETAVTMGRMSPGWKRPDVRRALAARGRAVDAIVSGMENELAAAVDLSNLPVAGAK